MLTVIKPTRSFSDSLLDNYRQQGDAPADAVIATIAASDGPAALRVLMQWLGSTQLTDSPTQSELIQRFFSDYQQLPDWANPARMEAGMAFFQKHAGQIGLILGCYSLPYTYLGAHGAQVLWLTERIKHDTTRRLQETGEWLYGVMNAKEWQLTARTNGSVQQKASMRTLKIRLIHAAARWFVLHSGRWNMAWGYPVNQEDMAGTNLAFSYMVLRGLRKMGVSITEDDEENYLHHVNVIGYLNGVANELLPLNLREAFQINRAISQRQFTHSEAGVGLTHSLLKAIGQQGATAMGGFDAARNLAAGEMRFFLGDTYADMLNIPDVPVEKRLAGLVNQLPIFPKSFSNQVI